MSINYEGTIRNEAGRKVGNPIKLYPERGSTTYYLEDKSMRSGYCDEIRVFFDEECYRFLPRKVVNVLRLAKKPRYNRNYRLITIASVIDGKAFAIDTAIILPHTACSIQILPNGSPCFYIRDFRSIRFRAIDGRYCRRSYMSGWVQPDYAAGSYSVFDFGNSYSSLSVCEIIDKKPYKHRIQYFNGNDKPTEMAVNAIKKDLGFPGR